MLMQAAIAVHGGLFCREREMDRSGVKRLVLKLSLNFYEIGLK